MRELFREGPIGPIQSIRADFGFQTDPATHPRLFDPSLGGGALLDVGVYPISLASMVLGSPVRVSSEARMGATGVDEHDAMVFAHQHGQLDESLSIMKILDLLRKQWG